MDLDGMSEDIRKENILTIVGVMSKVDGIIHENELVYLLELGNSLGISPEKVREVLKSENQLTFIPETEVDRMTIFYHLIFLIKVDGEVTTSEENLLHHFGLKLGLSPLLITDIIRVIRYYINRKLPATAILDEVKKYLN